MCVKIINRNVITVNYFLNVLITWYVKTSFLPKTIVCQFSGRYDILIVIAINTENIIIAVICLVFIIYLVLYQVLYLCCLI